MNLLASLAAILALATLAVTADPLSPIGHQRLSRYDFADTSSGGLPHPMPHLVRRALDPVAVATSYLRTKLGVPADGYTVQDSYTDSHNGVTHVHFMQVVNGTEVVNGVAGVSLDRANNVIAFHESFASPAAVKALAARKSKLAPTDAVQALATHLRDARGWPGMPDREAALAQTTDAKDTDVVWVRGASFAADKIWTKPRLYVDDESGALNWVVDVRARTASNWVDAQVSNKGDGAVLGLVDWTSAALYRAFPSVGFANDALEGKMALVQDPEDTALASPKGWTESGETSGNNILARESPNGATRPDRPTARATRDPQLGKLSFDFAVDPEDGNPKGAVAVDASITNAFYATNLMHDILYHFGFNEAAGNFQKDNFGRGGKGDDAVQVNVQDNSSKNNANFLTPPDGQTPVLKAFLFDGGNRTTDGALDDSILFHEYSHGMVGRLTGGGSNPNCLSKTEAGGMNEGWADIIAIMLKIKEGDTRAKNMAIASFSTAKAAGIRRNPYSTSTTTNPLTYTDLPNQRVVHQVGEIWASMLYEAVWNMIDKHGFQADWRKTKANDPNAKLGGNVIMMQLIVDGLKLQPCNPTFRQARDAIILADKQNNNGDNECELRRAFGKRGLGPNAGKAGEADFSVPDKCNAPGVRRVTF
ncbi:hypothetical protein H9P43_006968 [Blastocladiella emersonii ATCC 22665]|nr:hypothetical protein H9P43_006968 [Blastocladiella emersonii ATCC 22665]